MTRTCRYEPCGRDFEPTDARQEFCGGTCRANHHYAGRPEKGRSVPSTPLQSVATHPLADARGLQEEGGDSADYLILAREQIARTLLHTGWFTADDLEPLGIPQQYRRSVHGSATGYFSGEQPYMEEAGRRKSERPERKGAKNTVFRITARGRRELPRLLKDMAGPVTEATKRLYGQGLVGVGADPIATRSESQKPRDASGVSAHSGETAQPPHREGTAGKHESGTLDRPAAISHGGSAPNGARSSTVQGSPAESSTTRRQLPAGEPPFSEPVPLFEEEQVPSSAVTTPEIVEREAA